MKHITKYLVLAAMLGFFVQVTPCTADWNLESYEYTEPYDANDSTGTGTATWGWWYAHWTGSFGAGNSGLSGSGSGSAEAQAGSGWEEGIGGGSASPSATASGQASASWAWDGAPGYAPGFTLYCNVSASGGCAMSGGSQKSASWLSGNSYAGASLGSVATGPGGAYCAGFISGFQTAGTTASANKGRTYYGSDSGTVSAGEDGYTGSCYFSVYWNATYQVAVGLTSMSGSVSIGCQASASVSTSGTGDSNVVTAGAGAANYMSGSASISF